MRCSAAGSRKRSNRQSKVKGKGEDRVGDKGKDRASKMEAKEADKKGRTQAKQGKDRVVSRAAAVGGEAARRVVLASPAVR